jgi:Ca-activated chloride channel family protein
LSAFLTARGAPPRLALARGRRSAALPSGRSLGPQALIASLFAITLLHASGQDPRLSIKAPTETTYVAGEVLLVAAVEPAAAARDVVDVTFFADGAKVCAVTSTPFECQWDAGARIRPRQIRVVATLKTGGRLVQTVTTRELEKYVENVDVNVVPVTVVVTDDRGRFVEGLKQKDFEIKEDGVPQKISSFWDRHSPLELVTAIDVSSSVTDALPAMRSAAVRFLGGLEPTDQATVVGFNDTIYTLARRSTDQTMRERAIGRLRPWGGTALYDAIVQSIEGLSKQTGGRTALILFTDGDDQNSHAPLETAIAQVEASDAMIYAVGQGRAVHVKNLQKLLEQIATTSGGRAFFAATPAKLDEIFAEILDDLHHQYLLSYPAPDDQRDGKYHKVTVTVRGGKYHVRARQGYRFVRKH